MDIKELVSNNDISLPIDVAGAGDDYLGAVKRRVDKYISLVETAPSTQSDEFTALQGRVPELKELNVKLEGIVLNYISGKMEKAVRDFGLLMKSPIVSKNILKIKSEIDDRFPNNGAIIEHLYRIRTSEVEIRASKDMFHIPYSKRHMVATQRYSISGVPCLYCGGSLFVCWNELGKPDFNNVYLSRLELDALSKHKKVLDVSKIPLYFKSKYNDNKLGDSDEDAKITQAALPYLEIYPLMAYCYCRKRWKDSSFNIEYIIPNLFTQWVMNKKMNIIGIKYYSVHFKSDAYFKKAINYVFPTRFHRSGDNYCPILKSLFKVTPPVSWKLLETINDMTYIGNLNLDQDKSLDEIIPEQYERTTFGKFEAMISKRAFAAKPIR